MEYVFIKIGGSFITYKNKPISINYTALYSLGKALNKVLEKNDLRLVLGNGGGSFAHYIVLKYIGSESKPLLVKCHESTRLLNRIIVDYLVENNIYATSMQTSSMIYYNEEKGEFEVFIEPVKKLLEIGIIPVIYGECIPASKGPVIISTEQVFSLLAKYIKPKRIVLLTDVSGIYTCNPKTCKEAKLINHITAENLEEVLEVLKQSKDSDVTGGVYGKVLLMSQLSSSHGLDIIITSGFNVETVTQAILGNRVEKATIISMKK